VESFSTFLAMGGYGGFIWSAYGIVFTVLTGLLLVSLRALRSSEATLRTLQASEEDASVET
jgi:heme exporter protein D